IFVSNLFIVFEIYVVISEGYGLVIVLINTFTVSLRYASQLKIKFKIYLTIAISAILGALFGVWLLQQYSSKYFHIFFATILVALGFFLLYKNFSIKDKLFKNRKSNSKKIKENKPLSHGWFIPLGLL